MKKPLISIIIPVYNAEKYLHECIDSVINQDIGFLDNIELVLVNDGSKDSSDSICTQYAEKYPDNVVYISQKNGGVSHARNTGLTASTGEYIGFLDADDYMSNDILGAGLDYFNNTQEDVDVAIFRVVQFGSKNRERPINKKFNSGTRTVDLRTPEWHYVYPRVAPALIRESVAKRYHFHEEISFFEDARYISEILAVKMKMGIVDKGVYFNRMHDTENVSASITTGATSEKKFYQHSPKNVSLYLLKKYKSKNKYPPLYLQYLALYEMRWRIFYNPSNPREVLSSKEYKEYEKINRSILSLVSDETIVDFKLYNVKQRVFILNLKHNKDILKEARFNEKNKLVWQDLVLFNHMKKMVIRIDEATVEGKNLIIEGSFNGFIIDGVKLDLVVSGVKVKNGIKLKNHKKEVSLTPFDSDSYYRTSFKSKIMLDDEITNNVTFTFSINGSQYSADKLHIPFLRKPLGRLPVFDRNGNYTVIWQRGKITVSLTNTIPKQIRLVSSIAMQYMVKFTRKIISKIIRLSGVKANVYR